MFDPLSFYTPSHDVYIEDINPVPQTRFERVDKEYIVEETNAEDEILHVLDLPSLSSFPPYEVLYVILKLLAVNEIWNFQQQEVTGDVYEIFATKNVDVSTVEKALPWFNCNCTRFNSMVKLSQLPHQGVGLKKTSGYNDWLTRIISNDLDWLDSHQKHTIQTETSLRISENCGRTAQPEIIRKIKLSNMEVTGRDYIKLKEPALTSDNLGLKTWGSCLILGEKLLTDSQPLQEPILELGSGTGLIGIILSLLKYENVYLTDLAPILPNLQDNIDLNNVRCIIDELDWNDPSTFLKKYPIKFGTIILSDPIYSPDHPQLIHDVLTKLCHEGTDILIQVPLRRSYEDVRSSLWDLLSRYTLEYEETKVGSDEFGDIPYCFRKYTA